MDGRERWQRRYDEAAKRDAEFTTLSGFEVDPVYGPPGGALDPRMERIGWPGEFPFTRGLYATGYRGRPWTIRQFAGFGNAKQTNERYKRILAAGGGGLSVAFDMPTLMGRDSDDARALGEVGHCGVAVDSAADMDILFSDIPLGDVTTSMTISGPAVPVFCMYLVAAERQGVGIATLDGTLQTDIFKEYIAQKEWLFPPEPHLRLIGDLMEYCAAEIPAYKPISVSGYHIREAGSTAAMDSPTSSSAKAGVSRSTSSFRVCRSSSTRTSTSSKRSRSSGLRAGSGRGGCATCTARQPIVRNGCGSTPRLPV
jgi:methylmalonyl-CoA mutase N-terminal domain/subunit